MAHVRIVTIGKGTTLRNIKMDGCTTKALNQAANTLESLIHQERDILSVEVDYTGCDDSKTVEGHNPCQ